jgi:Na+/H+-dicarboxylate symporter
MAKTESFGTRLKRWMNHPLTIVGSVVVACALGVSGWPFIDALRPIGDIYIGLLKMIVLPFLLAIIPLAVRSVMTGATDRDLLASLGGWIVCAIVIVGLAGAAVPVAAFHFLTFDDATIKAVGALVGGASGNIDLTFALDANGGAASQAIDDSGLLSLIPSNIFAALSLDATMQVLVFGAIFGWAMAVCERRSGRSFFGALQSLHDTCLFIFQWLNVMSPIGIIALIAPAIAPLGPSVYVVLADFSYVFFGLSAVVLVVCIALLAAALRLGLPATLAQFSRPLMVAAATRNTIACIPVAVETMTIDLRASPKACEMYIPVSFATLRFGTMLHFAVAAVFTGALLGRSFGIGDMLMIAVLSVAASFATLGVNGAAALAPLAAVLRPFGLPYELVFPLLVIIDPLALMVRIMVNVAVNCLIPVLAVRSEVPETVQAVPAE